MTDVAIKVVIQNEDALKNLVTLVPEAAERALNDYIRTVKARVLDRTPVGQKYKKAEKTKAGKPMKGPRGKGRHVASGNLWRSWKVASLGLGAVSVYTDVPYADVLEEGKYPGIGPRTASGPGGIYSKQAVGGILGPLLEDKELMDGMVNRLIKEITNSFT
jgi:hypothetical protein